MTPISILAAVLVTAAAAWVWRAIQGIERAIVGAYNAGGAQ